MTAGPGAGEIVDNPAPRETAWREAAKRVLTRLLPDGAYQRVLARSKARDFATGRFREPELDLVGSLLRPGEVAVDVGANHGMWTLALSRAAGHDGRVYSFEPVPFTFGTLSAVVRQSGLGNVTLINRGCSDRVATMDMTVPLQRSGSSDDLQAHLAARSAARSEKTRSVTVPCEMTTLDVALADVERVALLKLDIEGAELLAMRGAAELIARELPAIVCEVDGTFLEGFGQTPADVVEFLGRWRYEPYRYDPDGCRLEAVVEPGQIGHANVIFLPESRLDRVGRFLS
jgi:FkbM family methyltransferase